MRADALANRRALLAAARELYVARGEPASFTAIAHAAGVGIATLYRNFPDERALAVGIVQELREQIQELAARTVAPMLADPAEAWPVFIDELVGLRFGVVLPQLMESSSLGDFPADLAGLRSEMATALDRVLDIAKAAGLLRADVDAVHFNVGLSLITRPVPAGVLEFAPDIQEWLVRTYLAGLRPPSDA